jgi:hypothetical protein
MDGRDERIGEEKRKPGRDGIIGMGLLFSALKK